MSANKKAAKPSMNPKQDPNPAKKVKPEVSHQVPHEKPKAKTRITAHFDCGFPNNLFIRGEGISLLSWEKGVVMNNISPNEWVWETDRPFSTAHFKILVNDAQFENGENHAIAFGEEVDFNPQF